MQPLTTTEYITRGFLTLILAARRSLREVHPCWQVGFRRMAEALFILSEKRVLSEKREVEVVLDDAQTRYIRFLRDFLGLELWTQPRYVISYLGVKRRCGFWG